MDRIVANRLADEANEILGGQQLREKHFDVFAVYLPVAFDGSSLLPVPPPFVRLIQPRPSVREKEIVTVTEGDGGGIEQARLQRFELTGISRSLRESELRPEFWLLLEPGAQVTQDTALTLRPRYRNMGTPKTMQDSFSVVVVEER